MCEDTCDTAALVISELVTNAIVHTASGVVVCELSDGDDLVRIAVRDQGCAPGEPHPSPQRPEEEHGRGLFLVDALCRAWGAQEHGTGLLVWADLARGADEAGAEVEPARGAAETAAEGSTAIPPAAARETDGTDFARLADRSHSSLAHALTRPRNDLGWGAPPKPGPADGSGDDNDAPTESDNGATPQDTTGATAPRDTTASSDATADTAPAGRHSTRDERIRERGERGGDHPDPSGHAPEADAKSGPASDPGDARPVRAPEDRNVSVDHGQGQGQVHSPAHGNRAVTPARRPHHAPGSEPRASGGDTRPATGPLNRLPHLPGHAHPADGPLPRVSQQWQRAGAGPGASVPGRSADPAGDAAPKPTGPQSKRSAPPAQPAPTTSAASTPAPASWNSAARDRGTG